MITGIFHQGSGLGNQLHRYVATRVLALDKGYEFSMLYPQLFKGGYVFNTNEFTGIDTSTYGAVGLNVEDMNKLLAIPPWQEKRVNNENGVDIRSYDPEFNFIQDGTVIDGEFQDERYWEHREKEVDEWLKVELLDMPDDVCVIGFRGGEFAVYPDLFLTKEYYIEAIKMMRKVNPEMKFEVHTDDKILAETFFEGMYPVVHDIGLNWRSMRYAKYAIIANSSFFILPRWLNKGLTIAPRYWGRHNTKVWSLPQNWYRRFTYI